MRLTTIAIVLASLPSLAWAAPTWQNISTEAGRSIELDRATLKRTGNVVEALSRVTLDRPLSDSRTGMPYRVIEATTRYDCASRSAKTIKRIYRQAENDVIREEEIAGAELPVRTGTLDDRVLREVCRPPKEDPAELAKRANEAASKLQEANAALLKKELGKEAAPMVKTVDKPDALIPSIRPNLKAVMEASRSEAAAPVETRPKAEEPPPPAKPKPSLSVSHGTTQLVHNNASAPRPLKPAPSRANAGYMLELVTPHKPVTWGYEGEGAPENWVKLDPRNVLCAAGKRQSPIDIRDGIKVDLEPIRFDYRPSTFRIVDTGHTVSVAVGDSSFSLTGKTYDLVDIHFHRPGETRINGQRYDMSAHFVHRSIDGQRAVIEVLMTRGAENPQIQTLWNNLPLEKHVPVEPPTAVFEPAALLPGSKQYYTFMGSLTTPPCTEDILWIVFKQPVEVSDEQLRIFSRLYRNNARPAQPIGDRLIKESR